jgi:glycosyltransferase involved in cell wall biosynthesis
VPSGDRPVVAERRSARGRLLVVSHPSVVSVNQAVYRRLGEVGWDPFLVVPARWRHEYAEGDFAPIPLAGLENRLRPVRVILPGRPQRHLYLTRPSRLIHEIRPRVAFLEQEPFSLSALQWGLALSRVGISFGVQADENLDRPMPRPARWIRSWILRRAAFVAARSPAAGELVRRWGAAGDVVIAPHAVPEWTAPPRRNGRPFTVGFAGRLVPEKGIDDLLEAVRQLDGRVRLLLVGDGPLRERLERENVPGGEIEVRTGLSHDRMPEAYAEMDVLVLPSRTTPRWSEQFGRVLVEALWCGLPVVGSDSGAIPWVIQTTGGGLVFEEGNPEALASALKRLQEDPEQSAAFADRGRSATTRLFSVEAAADVLDRALSAAADSPGVRRRDSASWDSRPTVALVAHGIHDQGGMERAFFELVRQGHRDCRFVVIAAELAPELRPLVEWKRIRVPMRPVPLKFVLFLAVAAVRLARTRADLVHTMGAIVPNRADLACVQFCNAGFREFVRGRELEGRPPLRRLNTGIARALGHSMERWWYGSGRVRTLAAVSPGVRRELERHYPGVRVEITPNGVDPRRLKPDAEARRELRAEQGLGEEDLVALFVGGDWDHKGLAVAIEAMERAAKAGIERLHLWVVGRGDDARFGELASRHGVAGRVRFFGPRRETERFFQAADVFVLPTLYETFSLVAYEAAASGLPIVATRVNGIDDLIGDGEAGLVVERSSEAVAAALVRLAADPAERARMGGAGRRRAETFTWERSVSSVLEMYRSLAPAAFPAAVSR